MRTPKLLITIVSCGLVLPLAACGASAPARHSASSAATHPASSSAPTTTSTSTASSGSSSTSSSPATSASNGVDASATSRPSTQQAAGSAIPWRDRPVIVIDPGHSPTVNKIDPKTGLNVSDYENEPEMHDVWKVALLVRSTLKKAGYRVYLTKKSVDDRVDLASRAYLANRLHAALAISIHDQAGANGGIGFHAGNNHVYYQSVGTYRATPQGKRIYFRNKHIAALSKKFGGIIRAQREKAQHNTVNLQGDVGYNLGSRGLAAGNIWIVQLLSKVPWVYNEAGGNSAGRVGLSASDRATYARGLISGIEKCVPPPHR